MSDARLPINHGDTGKVSRDKINDSFNDVVNTVASYRPHIEAGYWWIGDTNTGVKAQGDSIDMKVEDGYIWYKSESADRTQIIAIEDLKGDKGDTGNGIASIVATKVGKTTTVTITDTEGHVESFPIQDGEDGQMSGPSSSVDGHIAVFDGTSGTSLKDGGPVPEGNVKSFTLSSTSDLTNAQAAYDWYDDGNVAIIVYNDKEYLFDYATENNAYWCAANESAYDTTSATGIRRASLQLALSSGTVTAITTLNISVNDFNVLRTDKNYGTPYTPQYNGSPATKKYVDDGLSGKADSSSLGTAAACNTGTTSGNVPILDSNGKLATSTLPGVALTDTFTVSTSVDLTSLSSAEQGDLAIVTSENKTYVLSQAPYSTASNWKQILSPTGGVTSVNGQTGAVTVSEFTPGGTATTGYVVTKTADSYEWAAPTGGIQLAPNSEYNIKYHWYGEEDTYKNDISQYYTDAEGDTAYFTTE